MSPQPFQGRSARLNDSPPGDQRNQLRDTKLRQLFNQDFLPVTLRQAYGEPHRTSEFPRDFDRLLRHQPDRMAASRGDSRDNFPAGTVKKDHFRASPQPQHARQVMGFIALQSQTAGHQQLVREKPWQGRG